MARKTVTREELYEQVWMTPLTRLALQYGVSNVALGKTCRRLNVPTPGRGYWARLAAGERLKRPPLPKASPHQEWTRIEHDPDIAPVETSDSPPSVDVPQTLSAAHPVAEKLAKLLGRARLDEHERLTIGDCFAVTIETYKRALLLLSGLCNALEARGHGVELRRDEQGHARMLVLVSGEAIPLSLTERLERTERSQADVAREKGASANRANVRKYDYWPNQRLRLDILDSRLARSMWTDTDTRPLDRVLGNAIVGIEAAAADAKKRRVEDEQRRADEERRRCAQAEEHARARRREKLNEYQLLLARDLERLVDRWVRAKHVRDFADAYAAALPEEQRSDIAKRWLEAVRKYASNVDPLKNAEQIPLEIEPADEKLDAAIAELKQVEERLKSQSRT